LPVEAYGCEGRFCRYRSLRVTEQMLLNYAARLALQEAAKVDAAKVLDFAERRDEIERRRRRQAECRLLRERPL
jgi:hypothetical protein